MITTAAIYNQLFKCIKIKVGYSKKYETFIINDMYWNEIDASYFEDKIRDFENNLLYVLKTSKDKKAFLQEILDSVFKEIELYDYENIQHFSFVTSYVKTVKDYEINRPLNVDKYNIDYISGFDFQKEDIDHLINHFKCYEDEANNYESSIDLEFCKLLYVMQLHYKSIKELYASIYDIHMDADTLDFDELINLNFKRNSESTNPKCNVNLDKISTANLFFILIRTGFLSMNKNDTEHDTKLIFEFIENNFTYGTGNDRHSITKIYKEFSYIKSGAYKERQKTILAKLIHVLQNDLEMLK